MKRRGQRSRVAATQRDLGQTAPARLRIAIVNTFMPSDAPGGAEEVVRQLSHALEGLGHMVEIFCLGNEEVMEDSPKIDKTKICNVYMPGKRKPFPARLLWHFIDQFAPWTARRLAKKICKFSPDIVHFHNTAGLGRRVFNEIRTRVDVPQILTLHDGFLFCVRGTMLHGNRVCDGQSLPCRLKRRLNQRALGRVDLFVSPSEYLQRQAVAAGLAFPYVLRNGLAPSKVLDRVGRTAKSPIFLYAGQLTEHKGLRVLIDAVQQMRQEAEIRILGSGPLLEELRKIPRLRCLGYVSVSEKAAQFAEADALIVPSVWPENQPLVVIEALQGGLAVVATRVGGLPEMVREDENGLLVEPRDAVQLAAALDSMASDPVLLKRLQAGAYASSLLFNRERMGKDYQEIYYKMIQKPRHEAAGGKNPNA